MKRTRSVQQMDLAGFLQTELGVKKESVAPTEQAVRRLVEAPKESAEYMKEKMPSLGPDAYEERMLPEVIFSPQWSEDDEAQLRAAWAADSVWLAMQSTPRRKEEMTLWKACARVMRCLPTEIVSEADFRLRYKGDRPLWSGGFCDELRVLVHHPLFQGSKGLVAVALQYAVICRTNDCRPWPLRSCAFDGFLDEFAAVVASSQDGTKTVASLHRQVLANLQARAPHCKPSFWSSLFRGLERVAVKKNVAKVCGLETPVYEITIKDLANTIQALDDIRQFGIPVFPAAAWCANAVDSAREHKAPPVAEDFHRVWERAQLAEKRKLAMMERPEPRSPDT